MHSAGAIITLSCFVGLVTTARGEAFACLSIICTAPKTCQVVDEIAQCLPSSSAVMSSTNGIPPPQLHTNAPALSIGEPPELCSLPPVTGHCSKAYVLWFYNAERRKCERFSYSGCGNENRFYSRAECELTCLR
uniref:BPTI/Kunitz inhibitor domain-containing protein n=1 Tax=Parascaris univalens TaxID=6257 RepID=A0A915B2F5_PARUN